MDESTMLYLRLKKVFGGKSTGAPVRQGVGTRPFTHGRDPSPLADVMKSVTTKLGWDDSLDRADIIVTWAALVGDEVAQHSQPVFEDRTLLVFCESTAWASNLKVLKNSLLGTLREAYPRLTIDEIRFRGPDAPSWKRGPRSIPGRGPRDTYG